MCVVDGKLRVNAMLRDVLVEGKEKPLFSTDSVALQEEYWGMFLMLKQLIRAYADYGKLPPKQILDILIPSEGSCTCGS